MSTLNSVALVNSSVSNKRRALDFYPTPPDVTHALMQFLKLEPCAVWEPACGNGAMSAVLMLYGHDVYSTDIAESGYGNALGDFLASAHKCDAIITNPPFNISEQFIRHAITQAPIVAMVLKSQWF